MFSVVIRNKNEAVDLERNLKILTSQYQADIEEIIVVDNKSTDNSVEVAQKYNCQVINIENFTYGKAINMGISQAKSPYILLLSAHAIPVGKSFFKNTFEFIENKKNLAGIRYINSFQNLERAISNNYLITEPLKYGLMAACCIVSKQVWEKHKFDEQLFFSEDKEWSQRVDKEGYSIYEINESFFYFPKRSSQSLINRFKNETIAEYQLFNKKSPSKVKIVLSLIKKIIMTNTFIYFKEAQHDFNIARAKMQINRYFKNKK